MSREAILHHLRSALPAVAPSMLKCDFGDLATEVRALDTAGSKVLHWDVMDGHFVPNLSYGAMVIASLREQTEQVFDAHLMISEPERYLDDYLKAGCDCITVHVEAVPEPGPLLRRIREAGRVAGLALNPDTPVSSIAGAVADCDLILVMSVQPGFGGQSFKPEALEKLRQVRELAGEETVISVDGGIGPATIGDCAAAGADLFVAGSAVFDTDDYGRAIGELRDIASARRSSMSC